MKFLDKKLGPKQGLTAKWPEGTFGGIRSVLKLDDSDGCTTVYALQTTPQ